MSAQDILPGFLGLLAMQVKQAGRLSFGPLSKDVDGI
jgi:hypothetical protein